MPPTILSTTLIPELADLWAKTLGSDQICVAILDGFVDQSHPSFINANLTQLEPFTSPSFQGVSIQHGTHIASIIFGQHQGLVQGIAPNCRGVSIPIFRDVFRERGEAIAPCSQLDLARAILLAANHGAHIINISGGQLNPSGAADPILMNAIRHCTEHNILIVAEIKQQVRSD